MKPRIYLEELPADAVAVPGFPAYFVTPAGKVYRRWTYRNPKRAANPSIQEMAQDISPRDGRARVSLWIDGRQRPYHVHRLVCLGFHGEPPTPAHEARHLDGDQSHNHPSNLAWGTHQENIDDRERHGTTARGSRHGLAKLTETDVAEIRRQLAAGVSGGELARRYGVAKTQIQNIAHRRTWTHVPETD